MSDLHSLVAEDIPKGRQDLADSHTNLSRVAEYLETNYYNSENRPAALEESKKFTTQSLASVAYQINTLAYNFLQALELQQQQLTEVNGQVNHLAQAVSIHKEKVARREVGVLTTNKNSTRQFKIIAPSNPERPIKYERRPIDFTALDGIGHAVILGGGGVQKNGGGGGGTLRRSNHHSSATSLGSANNLVAGPAPTTRPPTPPQTGRGVGHTGTLSRSNKDYRTPPQIAPPQVPKSAYGPGQGVRSGYASAQRGAAGAALQVGTVHPMHHDAATAAGEGQARRSVDRHSDSTSRSSIVSQLSCGMVTEPGMVGLNTLRLRNSSNSVTAYRELNFNHFQQPQQPQQQQQQQRHNTVSQQQQVPAQLQQNYSMDSSSTLPPPPPVVDFDASTSASEGGTHSDWIPRDYLEKVVAVYDYRANKGDELSFYENSVIYVLKKNDDGWWEGVMDGVTGLFPGNYVESLRQ